MGGKTIRVAMANQENNQPIFIHRNKTPLGAPTESVTGDSIGGTDGVGLGIGLSFKRGTISVKIDR